MLMLLTLLQTDEERSLLSKLYHKHRIVLVSYAKGILGDQMDAEDVVHDVFRLIADKCMDNLQRMTDEESRRFLFVCTKNRAINLARRKSKVLSIEKEDLQTKETESGQADEALAELISNRRLLDKTGIELQKFPRQDAEILWLSIEGCTSAVIGDLIGLKPETVRKRLSRSRQKLRDAVFGEGDEPR